MIGTPALFMIALDVLQQNVIFKKINSNCHIKFNEVNMWLQGPPVVTQ